MTKVTIIVRRDPKIIAHLIFVSVLTYLKIVIVNKNEKKKKTKVVISCVSFPFLIISSIFKTTNIFSFCPFYEH